MYGNNLQATGAQRVNLLLKDQTDPTATFVIPGKRYFFPDNPFLQKKNIVGIEAHGAGGLPQALTGDFEDFSNLEGADNITVNAMQFFYITFYDDKGFIKFENIPLSSLLPYNPTQQLNLPLFKKVHPYMGKINFDKSFVFIPANFPAPQIFYIPLTFYYK
jgi:hypothetical protein